MAEEEKIRAEDSQQINNIDWSTIIDRPHLECETNLISATSIFDFYICVEALNERDSSCLSTDGLWSTVARDRNDWRRRRSDEQLGIQLDEKKCDAGEMLPVKS